MSAPARPSRSISPYASGACLADLLGPDLPGALCSGRAPLWDPALPGEDDEDVDYRQTAAARLCAECPARAQCAAAVAELHPAPLGVWAGEIRRGPRPGRSRRMPDDGAVT